jgi:hypothetical protein
VPPRRDLGVAQLARSSALADPIGGGARFAVGRGDAAGDANASVEIRSAIGKRSYPVVLQYLKDKKELPKWVTDQVRFLDEPADHDSRRTSVICCDGRL